MNRKSILIKCEVDPGDNVRVKDDKHSCIEEFPLVLYFVLDHIHNCNFAKYYIHN